MVLKIVSPTSVGERVGAMAFLCASVNLGGRKPCVVDDISSIALELVGTVLMPILNVPSPWSVSVTELDCILVPVAFIFVSLCPICVTVSSNKPSAIASACVWDITTARALIIYLTAMFLGRVSVSPPVIAWAWLPVVLVS